MHLHKHKVIYTHVHEDREAVHMNGGTHGYTHTHRHTRTDKGQLLGPILSSISPRASRAGSPYSTVWQRGNIMFCSTKRAVVHLRPLWTCPIILLWSRHCVCVCMWCVCVCRCVSVLSLNHLHKLEVMSLYRYTIFDVYKCCIMFII